MIRMGFKSSTALMLYVLNILVGSYLLHVCATSLGMSGFVGGGVLVVSVLPATLLFFSLIRRRLFLVLALVHWLPAVFLVVQSDWGNWGLELLASSLCALAIAVTLLVIALPCWTRRTWK